MPVDKHAIHQANTLPICGVIALSSYSLSVIIPAYNEEKTILVVLELAAQANSGSM